LKFYEITIRPFSGFGTPLKGDTLFGHFCWQTAYNPALVQGGLENVLSVYNEKPFAIFSSAFPKLEKKETHYILKRPDVPLSWLFTTDRLAKEEKYSKIKDFKKQKWMVIKGELKIDFAEAVFMTDKQLFEQSLSIAAPETRQLMEKLDDKSFSICFHQPHNTINRLTNTTGTGIFAPYSMENTYFCPETEMSLFVLIDEDLTDIEKIVEGLKNIGRFGFGRDASTGMGRFDVCEADEVMINDNNEANAFYTLAPCVPEDNMFDKIYFSPFVRFGKHGDSLANAKNPFKNPVIMADEGAVFIPKDKNILKKPYIGRAVSGVSKAEPDTVAQGYAPFLPLKLEQSNENQNI
jgi:CRISPR-associated protein Csm4